MTETRSTLDASSLQEQLDATSAPGKLARTGSAQYFTPDWFARAMRSLLPTRGAGAVLDPQCGNGALLDAFDDQGFVAQFGIELDRKQEPEGVNLIHGNCVHVWEILDDVFPDLRFPLQVANPPFSIQWKTKAGPVDSTLHTWRNLLKRADRSGAGYMIANRSTIERLGLHQDSHAWLYQTFPAGVFPSAPGLEVGVLHFHGEHTKGPQSLHHASAVESEVVRVLKVVSIPQCYDFGAFGDSIGSLRHAWETVDTILAEEKNAHPFNIWLDSRGRIRTYLSTREKLVRNLTANDLSRLARLNGSHPLALTPEKETRDLMAEFVNGGTYTFDPACKAAIVDALASVNTLAVPIMPVTDFQRVAYADEEESLTALEDPEGVIQLPLGAYNIEGITLTPGRSYPLITATYSFNQMFERTKLHSNEDEGTYTMQHQMSLSGADRFIEIKDNRGIRHRFLDRPDDKLLWKPGKESYGTLYHHSDALLWKIFRRPDVPTVAEKFLAKVARNLSMLATCEAIAGYEYYPGQRDYLARVATRDYALVAAATGVGKTLIAISLIQMKAPRRALIVAPQGTTRAESDSAGSLSPSQWSSEIRRFAPGLPVFELFSREDATRIRNANGGSFPAGVYVSYYEAMFSNGARETGTPGFTDHKACEEIGIAPPFPDKETVLYTDDIGKEVNGIRCIWRPCLATEIAHEFDMVCYDEAHRAQHLSSSVTQMMIRVQPRYRFAFTATPIPNIASDLFPIAGWLCVPGWYEGDKRNAAWPYARDEGGRFCKTFLATERDLTQEALTAAAAKKAGKCAKKTKVEKVSPIISSPARLLKLITSFCAYISKEACRADLPPRHIHDVRVPMGRQQAKLYAHYMERNNIPGKSAMEKAAKQVTILRAITADPAGSDWNSLPDLRVESSFNPKTAAILSLVEQMLSRGEQVVIVSARVGQSSSLQRKLHEAGIVTARIDSTVDPAGHTAEANTFKTGAARVLLMGIKCAQAHSFPQCPNLIIGSLEYSCGTFDQAVGRVWRVNSPRPVHVWCVLHKGSIEEVMFDTVATKGDSAAICLRGARVPRDHKPVDLGEVLALNFQQLASVNLKQLPLESETEAQWPELREKISKHAK